MSKEKYLKFLKSFFALAHLNAKKNTQMAFINADWPARHRSRPKEAVTSAAQGVRSGEAGGRDFQNTPAKNETRVNSILINDYLRILGQSGWEEHMSYPPKQETHIFQAPLSSERFKANVVSAMQKKKIIGVTSRYVIISKKK
ncbi:MAG: hypothetical protein U9R02_11165 [Thermodesulfobacteriota bacterium]|nr:hypothetical protein [Thermodesulfobacteriota bacterium]